MDEQSIAADLQKKIPEDAGLNLGDGKYPEDPAPQSDPDHSALPLENYVLKQEVAEFLSLPRGFKNNPEMLNQLERVISWASDIAGTHEPNDVMHVLFKRQSEMGIKDRPDKLQRIYQYVKISQQIDGLYDRQRALGKRLRVHKKELI